MRPDLRTNKNKVTLNSSISLIQYAWCPYKKRWACRDGCTGRKLSHDRGVRNRSAGHERQQMLWQTSQGWEVYTSSWTMSMGSNPPWFQSTELSDNSFLYLGHLVFNALLWHLRKLMQLAFPILKTSNDGLLYPLWQSSSKWWSATNFTSRSLLNIHIAWHIYLKFW